MRANAVLKAPRGEVVTRGISGGAWHEPHSSPEVTFGEGEWALPGLVDAHAHLAARTLDYGPGDPEGALQRARTALGDGVLLVLDKGWGDTSTLQMLETTDPETIPHVEAAGRIIAAPGGYYPDFALETVPEDLPKRVEEAARQGRGWVKLIGDWPRKGQGPVPNFDTGRLRSAVEAAGRSGARVAIHTMAPDVPSSAVAAGVHSIEHGLFLRPDDLGPLGDRDGIWVPTIGRAEALVGELRPGSSGERLIAEGLENVARILPQAVEAGVRVLCGTDLVGSPSDVADEAVRLAEYGLPAAQALGAVSLSGFEATGRSADFEIGSPADAVFFTESPLEDLGVLAHPSMVLRSGRPVG